MLKSVKLDLNDASDAIEHLLTELPKLDLDDKVDIGARINAVMKNCKKLDDAIKDDIKKKLKGKAGTVLGDTFKAVLKLVPCSRFQQAAFKEAEPEKYKEFCRDDVDQRVTYETR